VTVPVLGDTVVELNETFYVKLSNAVGASLADAVAIGSIANDDSGGTISFKYASPRKTEAAATATVTVVRSGGVAGGVQGRYRAANGSAVAGADYDAVSGVLSFGLGVTSLSFAVPIRNDSLDEGDETVNLTLSNPTGGATLGSRASSVLTIVDND
jgi:hypothetical protein